MNYSLKKLFRKNLKTSLGVFFIPLVLLLSCSGERKFIPDVSDINPGLQIFRFDQDFAAIDTQNFDVQFAELWQKYPGFTEVYFQQIVADRPIKKEEIPVYALEIIKGGYLDDILDSIAIAFPDLNNLTKDINEMMQFYRYYFQDTSMKTLVTFCSEFGVGACTIGEDTLGLGLDMYLGSEFSEYDPNLFPTFIRKAMTPEYIPAHLSKSIIQNMIPESPGNRMLDIMMYQGKVLYVSSHLLPHIPDSILMEYTTDQMWWVENNELQIWSHFLSNELLYSTRKQDFQKLVGPSPNAPGMPPEAPGQTANWIAWQIIKSYMKRYPDTSLSELLLMTDPQEILEKSRYRPG